MRPLLPVTSLTVALVVFACGPSNKPAQGPRPAASASASGSSASAPPPAKDVAVCTRVCAVQTRCGGDPATCRARCMPIARTLTGDVLEAMVTCVETKASPTCEPGEAGATARRKLVGACTLDATKGKEDEARANVELFASAYCERTQQCGVEGTFVKMTCMGKAKGTILNTETQGGSLYGALRPTKVDEIVKCLRDAPCENRKGEADEELERCLDAALASAAESP